MMAMKKSQASIFLILGVILVITVIFYLLLTATPNEVEIEKGFDDISIDTLIQNCIDVELDNGLFLLGFQGGYVHVPLMADTYDMFVSKVPYWLKDGIDISLSDEFIASELGNYLDNAVPKCIQNTNMEYKLDVKKALSEVSIMDDAIFVGIDVDAIVISGNKEKKTGRFTLVEDIRMGMILDKARKIVADLSDGEEVVEVDPDNSILVIVYDQGNETLTYSIIDNESIVKGSAYQFTFAIEMPPLDNYPPILDKLSIIKVNVGERVYIDYNATDDFGANQLTYSLTSFNIPSIDRVTGEIDFTPTESGLYQGVVSVVDGFGQKDSDTIIIEVTS